MRTLRVQAKVPSGSLLTSNFPRTARARMPSVRKEYVAVLEKEELSVLFLANLLIARLHAEILKMK